MKTFKKLLALVLAVVMCVALVTVAAGAAEITDMDTVDAKCETAVGVMNGMGIITGYEDGSFKPTNEVTREQAAKIIAYMLLGKTDADSLKAGTAPFADVAVDRWSAGYIAYCQAKGIINGKDENTFDPAGTIKGTEFAKMLLAACGYGAAGEYVGAGWDSNVNVDALDNDIFKGNLSGMGAGVVTREFACLYAYNALTAAKVATYSKTLGMYTSFSNPGALGLAKYDYTVANVKAGAVITDVQYIAANAATGVAAHIEATASWTNPENNQDTATFTFTVDSFDVVGHVVNIYYANPAAPAADVVLYADYQTESAVVADASKLTAVDYYQHTTNKTYPTYENYASVQAAAVANGDTVIYTVSSTGVKTIVAIQKAAYLDGTIDDTYVAADLVSVPNVPAYNYATLKDSSNQAVYVIDSGIATGNNAKGAYWYGTATYTKATATLADTPVNVYYRAVGSQNEYKYYEINGATYVTGLVSLFVEDADAQTQGNQSKLTVDGKVYTVNADFFTNGTQTNTDDRTIGAAGSTVVIGTATTTFRLNAAGEIYTIVSAQIITDLSGFKAGYIVEEFDLETLGIVATNGGEIAPVDGSVNVAIVFADGTYGVYKVAAVDGQAVVFDSSKTTDTTDIDYDTVNTSGWLLAKVVGDTVEIRTQFAANTYAADSYTQQNPAPTGAAMTATTVKFGNYYLNAESKAVYYQYNSTTKAFTEVTVKTGAHAYAGVTSSTAANILLNNVAAPATKTVAVALFNDTTTNIAGDVYYVSAYLGEGATGSMYTAYKLGTNTAVTLTIDGTDTTWGQNGAGFYKTQAAVANNKPVTDLVYQAQVATVTALDGTGRVDAFTPDGTTYYITAAATEKFAADVVILDLRTAAQKGADPVASAKDFYAEAQGYMIKNSTTGVISYLVLTGTYVAQQGNQ